MSYVRVLPPAGGGAAVVELPLPVRALYGVGFIQDAAAKIDHALPVQQPVPEGVTVEHGRYVANTCPGCHGRSSTAALYRWSTRGAAARLSKGADSAMTRYPNAEAWVTMFRSGKRADGSEIKVMPFGSFSRMSDTDLRALHLYLKSL